jgi:cellulose synthase/poly-beta-1,6-N-acetylglucosamine synthase-like glycosyltransferase
MIGINLLLFVVALLLAIPCIVFSVECFAAMLPWREKGDGGTSGSGRIALVVAAHDEEAVIADTLSGLVPELGKDDLLLVVADNCTDGTAAIARSAGATVAERHDPDRRGKGYALQFGFDILAKDPPAVVVVVDADCRVSAGTVRRLADCALAHNRPVQGDNLLTPRERATPLSAISTLAFLVRNRVRPMGLRNLGLGCHLMGTGMAVPWEILRMAPSTGPCLAEDLLMGIDLAMAGFPPIYCASAQITSSPPERNEAVLGQRRRWEHGHLALLIEHAPRTILRGILRRRLALAAMGFDLLVPPLALLIAVAVLSCAAAWGGARFGASIAPLAILLCALGLVLLSVALAWLKFGRALVPARYLLMAPVYVLWKIPLYVSFLLHGSERSWNRTERTVKDSNSTSIRPS